MPLSKHYIVQLAYSLWLAPWCGDPGRTASIRDAKRFPSRAEAERSLEDARMYSPFREAFVVVQRATVI